MKLSDNRRDYSRSHLNDESVPDDPLEQFRIWMEDAISSEIIDPTAMILSTCPANKRISSRVVLLKDFSSEGFVFYTNYQSRKAKEFQENPNLSLIFF